MVACVHFDAIISNVYQWRRRCGAKCNRPRTRQDPIATISPCSTQGNVWHTTTRTAMSSLSTLQLLKIVRESCTVASAASMTALDVICVNHWWVMFSAHCNTVGECCGVCYYDAECVAAAGLQAVNAGTVLCYLYAGKCTQRTSNLGMELLVPGTEAVCCIVPHSTPFLDRSPKALTVPRPPPVTQASFTQASLSITQAVFSIAVE